MEDEELLEATQEELTSLHEKDDGAEDQAETKE